MSITPHTYSSVTVMSEGPVQVCVRVATIILFQVSKTGMCELANKEGLLSKQNSNSCVFNCLRAGLDSIVSVKNHYKVLKCGAGEGWRRSVGSIM